jgi:hypothetical protein
MGEFFNVENTRSNAFLFFPLKSKLYFNYLHGKTCNFIRNRNFFGAILCKQYFLKIFENSSSQQAKFLARNSKYISRSCVSCAALSFLDARCAEQKEDRRKKGRWQVRGCWQRSCFFTGVIVS